LLYEHLKHGVAGLVDAIGWHIQGTIVPESINYKKYPEAIRDFKREAEAQGFKGIYMASEAWWGAPYPPHEYWPHPAHTGSKNGLPPITEIRKAKDMARTYLMNEWLDVITFWCCTWLDFLNGEGLFRNTFAADPLSPVQPEAAFYVMRTLCTVMDGAEPAEFDVTFKGEIPPENISWWEIYISMDPKLVSEGTEMPREYDHWCFRMPEGGLMIGVYLTGQSVDRHPGVKTDVTISGVKCRRVVGIDILNGFEQELEFEQREGRLVVAGVLVRDYPVMLRLYGVD
jgi:hypothetical protein